MAAASLILEGGLSNPNPVLYTSSQKSPDVCQDPIINEIFDLIRDIKDPEHPHTLEELNVVRDDCITVQHRSTTGGAIRHSTAPTTEAGESAPPEEHEDEEEELWIKIEFTPTVPHCSLATLIGLCLRAKLERSLDMNFKLDIVLSKGTHTIEGDVNKQINDKERVAAAMENPSLRDVVEQCIKDAEY